MGVIPPSLDQVVIGDVERTRIKNIRALFFVGANDSLLPGNMGSGGLLSERDREQFQSQKIALSPGPKEQTYVQKFYLYMNLTKPSEYLFLSWSKVSGDGKTLRPAYLVQDIRRLFPDIKVCDEEKRPLSEREMTRKGGIRMLAEGLRERRAGLDDNWKEMYTWFGRDEKSRRELDQILRAGFLRKGGDRLAPETAAELYRDPDRVSVTRLEQFASCAYAHFLNYGLRLSDREEYGFEAMDLGNIAHQALERFARRAEQQELKWTEMTEEKREELIGESVEESILDYGNTVLFSSARNEYMIRRIKSLIRRSVWALTKQLEKGDFAPSGYELRFGSGKIDRIDTCEDEGKLYVRVTDYKTGMKAFDITAFYHGLQMQLPVYLNAALGIEKKKHPDKEIVPAGIFYYRIQDPLVDRADTREEVENSILKELKLDGLVNAEENVVEHLEHGLSGSSVLFPIGRNKDGSLSQRSKALAPEEFDTVLAYTEQKEKDLKEQMYRGEANAAPYEMGNATACDYCACRDICGFDQRVDGYAFRTLEKYSVEEAVEKMKERLENTEEEEKENGRKSAESTLREKTGGDRGWE